MNAMLRINLNEQMHMIGHCFQFQYLGPMITCYIRIREA